MSDCAELFLQLVQRVISNWTALKLAVEHDMGGRDGRQKVVDVINYIKDYCIVNDNVEIEELKELLEDIMDEEFQTICQDDSPKEIAHVLYHFLHLLKQGEIGKFSEESSTLPETNSSLYELPAAQNIPKETASATDNIDESSNSSSEEVLSTDPGWTVVRTRRRH